MKFIYVLFLIILECNLYASFNYSIENEASLKSKNVSYSNSNNINTDKRYNQVSFVNKTDLKYNKVKLSWDIKLYSNSSKIHDNNGLHYHSMDKANYRIRKLYLYYEYPFKNYNVGVAYGVIPFTGGYIKQYSNQDIIDGNGLFTLINITLKGYWCKYSTEKFSFILGHGEWHSHNFYNSFDISKHFSKSNGIFFSSEYNDDKLKYHQHFQFDIYTTNIIFNNMLISKNNIFGFGYSYESYETSIVLYNISSYNVYDYINNKKIYGYGGSVLFGVKKYLDINQKEMDIGVESFNTFNKFYSANNGDLYTNEYSDINNIIKNSIKVYMDYYINKNTIISANIVSKQYEQKKYFYSNIVGSQISILIKF